MSDPVVLTICTSDIDHNIITRKNWHRWGSFSFFCAAVEPLSSLLLFSSTTSFSLLEDALAFLHVIHSERCVLRIVSSSRDSARSFL
jgi:hypothetical protein